MKFLAIFAAVVAVASAYSVVQTTGLAVSEWTLNDLSEAIQNPATDPAMKPYLIEAMNELMAAMYAGNPQTTVSVVLPPMDVSTWTLQDLDQALTDPSLNPALKPYLEHALNQYMESLFAGQHVEAVVVNTPAGLLPIPAMVPEPSPVGIAPSPVMEPTPVETESSPVSSPLVQIIVNINGQQAEVPEPVADAILPSPALVPENTADLPQPEIVNEPIIVAPEPVQVVEAIVPEPVLVAEPIVPEPVLVAEPIVPEPVLVAEPILPEPVEVATPVLPSPNPIDVIAVAAPEVNPVDMIHPVPVAPETAAGVVVGPIV